MSEGAFKGCRSGRSNAPWGWTQLNGCPQRMKEKWTFDLDYVSILQNATTCHKVDFNSDSNVFCFPTISPHVFVQNHSQSRTNPKGPTEADMIGTPQCRWVHHHILFMDRGIVPLFHSVISQSNRHFPTVRNSHSTDTHNLWVLLFIHLSSKWQLCFRFPLRRQ